ncbi:MAG TPA: hemerythrin domain-containing protein [Chryseosolibacter sp.]
MNKPIKRHDALKSLSRDHHNGLLLSWKIREGFKRGIHPDRIKRYTDWFWENHLYTHFETEERQIFPVLGNDHKLVKKALAEHRRLKRLFEMDEEKHKSLGLIEEELELHIRFEERILLNEVQKVATPLELVEIEKHNKEADLSDDWEDKFWQ